MKVINPNSKISNDEALGIQNILKVSLNTMQMKT